MDLRGAALHEVASPAPSTGPVDTGVPTRAAPPGAEPGRPGEAPAEIVDPPVEEGWAGGLRPFDRMGTYRLLDRLGLGGMAEVFLAHAVLGDGIERLVALKMALPEFGPDTQFGALFLNEARVSVTLQHPNIVQVFDVGEFAGRPYLAMEYLQGWSVTHLLKALRARHAPPPPGLALSVGVELCKALEYVHEKRDWEGRPLGLVHRDVSGANVHVSELGEVKLLDFGAAAADGFAEGARLLVGKPGYIAPEQYLGVPPAPASDVYSLGVVLHEMLTLERRRGSLEPPAPPRQLNPAVDREVDRLVRLATSASATERPSTKVLRAGLEQARLRIGGCDLAALGADLLGEHLREQKAKVERLVGQARRLSRPPRPSFAGLKLRSWRRRLAATRIGIWLAGHRAATRAIAAGLLLAVLGPGALAVRWWRTEAEFTSRLEQADRQLTAGRLAGPGGDSALDLLLAAQKLRPGDERALRRLRALSDAFEELARLAEERSAPAEAAVYLQGALQADAHRQALQERLRRLEAQVRSQAQGDP
ncbi:MAG: serine/threonine-protein kinase [Myxococcales bacterium]